jgi:hypothetical protein
MADGVDEMGWDRVRDVLGVEDMDVSLGSKGHSDSGCYSRCSCLMAKFDAFCSKCTAIKEGGWSGRKSWRD